VVKTKWFIYLSLYYPQAALPKIFWRKAEGNADIHFNNVPFSLFEHKNLDCQFGEHYYKERPPIKCQKKLLHLQGSTKICCAAHITIKGYILYPDYKLVDSDSQLSRCAKRLIQEMLLQKLYSSLLKEAASVPYRMYTMCHCQHWRHIVAMKLA